MRFRPVPAAAVALVAAAGLVPGGTAAAEPPTPHREREVREALQSAQGTTSLRADQQRGIGAAELATAAVQSQAARAAGNARGYPRQTILRTYPVNAADASIKLGLIPYHAIAPRLNALQAASNRVSVQVIGQSIQGRDLYLVTLTAPETPKAAKQQRRIRHLIENDPDRVLRNPELRRRYKAPVFLNSNIHGNEWEGTDASMRLVARMATTRDPADLSLLRTSRIYVNITMNPDGRVAGTRANAAGFNMNRDFVTVSQPEVRAVRDALIATQPVAMLDLHGYVNGTLIEPTTPPHGENYEYDLFIKHAYPNGLRMEAAVNALGYTEAADGVLPAEIPFRDYTDGWDDWPPIFTPQYAAFHAAVATHTIEIPLRVNNADYTSQPVAELRRRSAINTNVAAATIEGTFGFFADRRTRLVRDQAEWFRRGAAGEPQRYIPDGFVPGFGPEDRYTTTFPRGYAIPVGARQRSAPAAARLVDLLVSNDVQVRRLTRAAVLGGTRYPAGSYLVDMHQPKRGLANVMLAAGRDISADVPTMYDISGWSHSLLWGASVRRLGSGPLRVRSVPVTVADPTGAVPSGAGALLLSLDDAADVRAAAALAEVGISLRLTLRGDVLVPGSARATAARVARTYGVVFRRAPAGSAGVPFEQPVLAAAVPADELFTLQELGFDVRPVSNEVLDAGFDWSGIDVLVASSGLSVPDLEPAARTALEEFVRRGGVVTRGIEGATLNADLGLLTATTVEGRFDANGVVRVRNSAGPVASDLQRTSFVSAPLWFTGLGAEVSVEQRYAGSDVLVSGHWRAEDDGSGGPAPAAGQASVVRGLDEAGAAVVMFGTEPMYRNHIKGSFAAVARSIYWTAASAGTPALLLAGRG